MRDDTLDTDYVEFGTPLEPYEDDAPIKLKPKNIEDQVVTDDQGRRRFHGAFTGGFSAGYFNSVGSKEGWAPSSFTSSREKKAEKRMQKPEDFMDETDFSVFGIAPRVLRPKDAATQESSRKRPHVSYRESPIPGIPALADLLKPAKESIGMKLLKKLGWKLGQGIGPRLTHKQKAAERKRQTYGCALPHGQAPKSVAAESSSEDESDDPETTFAPDDLDPMLLNAKADCFGLGYQGLERHSVLSCYADVSRSSLKLIDKKKKVAIQGQAFGVGAFEEEDEDIYALEDMSRYDFMTGNEETPIKAPAVGSGRDLNSIDGFIPSQKHMPPVRFYPPPVLPRDFIPVHHPSETEKQSIRFSLSRGKDSSKERKAMLGQDQEKLTKTDKKILVSNALQKIRMDLSKKEINNTVVTGKQENHGRLTEWEEEGRKLNQDEVSALVGHLASRFVSSQASITTVNKVEETDEQKAATMKLYGKMTRQKEEWHPDAVLCKRFNIANPHPGSEEVGTVKPKPVGGSIFAVLSNESHSPGKSEVQAIQSLAVEEPVPDHDLTNYAGENDPEVDQDIQEHQEDMSQDARANKENERPPMDLFKAVFQSSDSEDEDPEEAPSNEKTVEPPSQLKTEFPCKEKKASEIVEIAPRPKASGLFSGIDMDLVNQKWQERSAIVKPVVKKPERTEIIQNDNSSVTSREEPESNLEFYGPVPPITPASTALEDRADTKKKKKKLKQKHKHKRKHKHGVKHKKK